uniref:Uncharacterized protein n=1 Tax=Siphoviridae sp. ctRNB7 TaxID=2825502 RepID=A0A8S5PWW0_9CAUD|nr:MAG TPA: hypothetical protein [Siphoviridae sp. ctRNB7]
MKTVFKVGMEVYDQVFFGKAPLKITEVKGDMTLRVLCGGVIYCYTGDGRFIGDDITSNRHRGLSRTPTLSTSPYTLQGFEQKVPAPTYDEIRAESLKKGEYVTLLNGIELPDERMCKAFEALAKLIWLRDYYNEGWQPDWAEYSVKWTVEVICNRLFVTYSGTFSRALYFKTKKIAYKFIEEQKELLEIAKPLL